MNTDDLWYFESFLQGTSVETTIAAVRNALQLEFQNEVATKPGKTPFNCVPRSDGAFAVSVTGLKYPARLEDVWSRLGQIAQRHQLTATGVYRVRPARDKDFLPVA